MKLVPLTILHSNDMHGDFLAEARAGDGALIGGLSLLSGYISDVRASEPNVLYVIAGDMLQGSIIDSEYRGASTIEIMNYLAPDVVTLGNHEFDYGLPHMLFLERVANFPIVNANLYIKKYNKRMMQPYHIARIGGLDVLFIGIITEKVMAGIATDTQVASFITLEDAAAEVGHITNAYKHDDIDLTVLLTHIGYDSDVELAKMLLPEWGVDLIIGGHSHTVLEQPTLVNGVLIAQAGVGTDQIGRFDLQVDDDTNGIAEYRWQLVHIDEHIAAPDEALDLFIDSFKTEVDRKYSTVVTKLATRLAHPLREVETPLGNLVADAMAEGVWTDLMLQGSGAIRFKELGPLVTLGDLLSCFPFDEAVTRYTVTGAQLRRIFSHIMRPENRAGEGECYQVNRGVRAVYCDSTRTLDELQVRGEPVGDDDTYTMGLTAYHEKNAAAFLGVSAEELRATGPHKVVSTSMRDVLDDYLRHHQNLSATVEGRLVYLP
jgi:5'-nucleotidase